MEIERLIKAQRDYFREGKTLRIVERVSALKRLKAAILARREPILAAIELETGKDKTEAWLCEVSIVLAEIDFFLKKLPRLVKARRRPTQLAQLGAKAYEIARPLGNALILSPWNYPFLLAMQPLVDAVAAGDTVILKPSSAVPAVAELLVSTVAAAFPGEYVTVITGDREIARDLTDRKFDVIFFTGSVAAGREVYRRAAENLTPVILELGGKSPCIVTAAADLAKAARRIVFGKFLNGGQTCVAPDYLLVEEKAAEPLLAALKKEIERQYPGAFTLSPSRLKRLRVMLAGAAIRYGGLTQEGILPTLVDELPPDSPLLTEEIFGPILPLLKYRNLDEALEYINSRPVPLALYLFCPNKKTVGHVMETVRFGGGCVNDTVMQLSVNNLSFGGVGESGIGRYHGEAGFYAFSFVKSVLSRGKCDISLRYRPYTEKKKKLIEKFRL